MTTLPVRSRFAKDTDIVELSVSDECYRKGLYFDGIIHALATSVRSEPRETNLGHLKQAKNMIKIARRRRLFNNKVIELMEDTLDDAEELAGITDLKAHYKYWESRVVPKHKNLIKLMFEEVCSCGKIGKVENQWYPVKKKE